MYKKKNRFNKGLIIFISIIVIFICLFYSLKLNRDFSFPEKILKDGTSIITKVFMYPFTALNGEKGEDQTESYQIQKNVNVALEKEIEELKQALELNETMTSYTPVNATILTRNKSYWFQTITIDKGSNDGIKSEMAVVTKNGLIGKISKVNHNSSEIKLLTSDDVNYKVSVSITTDSVDTYAILNGYDKKKKCLKVVDVDKESNIKKGDVISTSGLGGKFPRGIYVGVVDSVKMDKYDVSKTIYVSTAQDFNDIHYVTVLKDKEQ